MLLFLLACTPPPEPVSAPSSHSWAAEAELVVSGLKDVERLWDQGQKAAARTQCEHVYTERFEPRLEHALREMEGAEEALKVEYAFGQLIVSVEGRDRAAMAQRMEEMGRRVRAIGLAAERAFPPPGKAAEAPAAAEAARPIVPDVPPNWEVGEAAAKEE